MARKLALAGVILALVGLTLFGVTSIPVTRVTEEIHDTFAVGAGSSYGPYDAGTVYHTRVLVKSALKFEVFVEGEGIYLTVNGYNTQDLRSVYIDESKTFVIESADDLYTFTFDNSRGTKGSLVGFSLSEIWTGPIWVGSPPLFLAAMVGLFLLLPSGLITLAMVYLRSPKKESESCVISQELCWDRSHSNLHKAIEWLGSHRSIRLQTLA